MATQPKKQVQKQSGNDATVKAKAEAAKLLEEKEAMRREVLTRRQQLRPGERSARSRSICNQLLNELRDSKIKGSGGQSATVAVYAALRFEVDLDRFIRGAYALGYRLVFPCMIPHEQASGAVCMRSVSCLNYLGGTVPFIVDPMKPWGPAPAEEHKVFVNEPVGSPRRYVPVRGKGSVPPKDDTRFPVVSASDIDAAIIPLVAFDAAGNRLGYGRGVYDRYLAQLRKDCLAIGVAFAEQEVDAVPHGKHDMTLPRIISA